MKVKSENICPICNVKHELELPEGISIARFDLDFRLWKYRGEKIQTVFTYLTADQREILISGTCQEAWDLIFSEDEQSDDPEFQPDDNDENPPVKTMDVNPADEYDDKLTQGQVELAKKDATKDAGQADKKQSGKNKKDAKK